MCKTLLLPVESMGETLFQEDGCSYNGQELCAEYDSHKLQSDFQSLVYSFFVYCVHVPTDTRVEWRHLVSGWILKFDPQEFGKVNISKLLFLYKCYRCCSFSRPHLMSVFYKSKEGKIPIMLTLLFEISVFS